MANIFGGAVRDFAGEALSRLRGSLNDRELAAASDGFNAAANVCVDLVSGKIDEVKQGSSQGKTEPERSLLLALFELKTEMESELRAFDLPGNAE